MKTWREFRALLTENKNTHMTHLEDAVLYGGVTGARDAILALRSMRDMLGGKSEIAHKATVKWDGAPAIFAGQDPSDGQFFVAKKSIFAKDSKVYKTKADIDADIDGELARKFHIALEELPKLGIKGVIQGDMMFTTGDVESQNIDGESYITFQPNTIVYAIPANSDLAGKLQNAKIGVVWHTSYSGDSFENMKASFGVDISGFNDVPSIWSQDAMLKDLSGSANMTAEQTAAVNAALQQAGQIFNKIKGSVLKELENNRPFAQTLETFNNTYVRRGEEITDTSAHVDALIDWANERFEKEIEKRKSEKGKDVQKAKRDEYMKFFTPENKEALKNIYDLQAAIVTAKNIIVRELDQLKSYDTFVKTKNGFKVTKGEGFVAIDHLKGNALKLVDRLEFSSNNFNPDVLKGWDK